MFGQHGTEVFDGFTSEQRSDPEFVNAMTLFYNAGNNGTSIDNISERYRFLGTQEQCEAMYKAGIADGELDSDGTPIFAKNRKEAKIEGTDFSKLNKTRKQADVDFGLERQESVSLIGYINTTFHELNRRLYSGADIKNYQNTINNIISALKKFPTYEGRTYRNLKFESDSAYNDFLAKYVKGKKVALEAFTSTSKRPNGYPIFEGRVVHMVIDGQTGADIADTYGLPRQQEVIYLPGTEIEITNLATANDGNPIIYAQEVKTNDLGRNNENSKPAQGVVGNREENQRGESPDSGYDGRRREIRADSRDNGRGYGVLSGWGQSNRTARVGQGRADRITANDTVQAGEAGRSKMFGQRGTEVFDGFTSEQRSNPEFVNAMALFYNAGNKGTSVNDISEQYRFVGTQEQREAMYKAGIADAARSVAQNGDVSYSEITEKGGTVNEEKTARYGRGQERTPGVASGGQGRSMEAGTGSFETGRPGGDQAQRAVSIRNRADAAGIVSQSTQAQGISIGTDNKILKVLPSNLWDDEIRTVVREKAQSGIHVVPFVGQLECKDKNGTFTANGWMSPDGKRMYVRADHDTLTMKQLSDHEEYHDKARKDKKLDAKLKKQLAKEYGKGWEKFLSRAYAEIYFSGQDMDKSLSDYILQEILADAYAGIDVLRNVENVPMRATDITAQVRETADRVKSRGPPIQTDGGAGRFSIERIIGENGTDYGIGVYLDSNLLEGLTNEERVEMIRLRLNELSETPIIAYDQNGNETLVHIAKSSEKFRNSKGRKVSVNQDILNLIDRIKIKGDAIVQADELLSAGQQGQATAARHPHDWLDNNGKNSWDKWTVYIQEKNKTVWEAVLHVANSQNGKKFLYNINPIKMVEGAGRTAANTTSVNIPQNKSVVNGKFSREGSLTQEQIDGEGRFSRDFEERNRALREGEMVNEFKNKVNWRAYYNKLNSVEFNSENYDDGDRTIMRLGGQLLTLEMQRNGEFSVVDIKEVKYETDAEDYERDADVHAREKLVQGRAGNDDWRNRVGSGRESDGEKSVGHSEHSADTKRSGESRTADYKSGAGEPGDFSRKARLTQEHPNGNFSREGSLTQEQVDRLTSYYALVNRPDMTVTEIDDTSRYTANSQTRKALVQQAIKNAAAIGKTDSNGGVSVYVDDIGRDVLLSTHSLRHGLDRRFSVLAPVTEKAGEILQNSILINQLTPQSNTASSSYVLLGAAKNAEGEPYIVRFVVNRHTNEVAAVDVLYAINAKKESAALLPAITGNPATLTDSTISIAQLLDFARDYFPDMLPESVLRHYGFTERPGGKLSESALFSREADLSNPELQERLTALLEEYGAITLGKKPFRESAVPKQTSDNNRVSQTIEKNRGAYLMRNSSYGMRLTEKSICMT